MNNFRMNLVRGIRHGKDILAIAIDRDTAIQLISTLAQQLELHNPNAGGGEFITDDGHYMTIGVFDTINNPGWIIEEEEENV